VWPLGTILAEGALGRTGGPTPRPDARARRVHDTPKWAGHEVGLDGYPDVVAWGILLVPKGIREGERRPGVVCQHGRNGLPKDVVEGDSPAYHDFAARLAERGFVTFAPHHLSRGAAG